MIYSSTRKASCPQGLLNPLASSTYGRHTLGGRRNTLVGDGVIRCLRLTSRQVELPCGPTRQRSFESGPVRDTVGLSPFHLLYTRWKRIKSRTVFVTYTTGPYTVDTSQEYETRSTSYLDTHGVGS